jgi:hypothetical protein
MMTELTHDWLKSYLYYDDETKTFTWRKSRGRMVAGEQAGCLKPNGQHIICIFGNHYAKSRLAHFYNTGKWPTKVRHGKDRHIPPVRGALPYRGVCYMKSAKKYLAQYCRQGMKKYLGLFDTAEEASAAYDAFVHNEIAKEALANKDLDDGFI